MGLGAQVDTLFAIGWADAELNECSGPGTMCQDSRPLLPWIELLSLSISLSDPTFNSTNLIASWLAFVKENNFVFFES